MLAGGTAWEGPMGTVALEKLYPPTSFPHAVRDGKPRALGQTQSKTRTQARGGAARLEAGPTVPGLPGADPRPSEAGFLAGGSLT